MNISTYVCVPHACLVPSKAKRASKALELELQVIVNLRYDAVNWSLVPLSALNWSAIFLSPL